MLVLDNRNKYLDSCVVVKTVASAPGGGVWKPVGHEQVPELGVRAPEEPGQHAGSK